MNYSLPSLSSRVRALINHPDPQWKKNNRRRLHPHQPLRRRSHPQSTTPTFPPPPHPHHEPPKQTPTPTRMRTSCSVITVQSFSASKLASRIAETPASTTKTGRRRSGTTLGRALSWCLLFGSSVRFALSLIFLNRSALNSEDWKWSWVVRMEVWFFFFFFFGHITVSMTLILGVYGSVNMRLGPNCSILLHPNPLFVQYLKVACQFQYGSQLYLFMVLCDNMDRIVLGGRVRWTNTRAYALWVL